MQRSSATQIRQSHGIQLAQGMFPLRLLQEGIPQWGVFSCGRSSLRYRLPLGEETSSPLGENG